MLRWVAAMLAVLAPSMAEAAPDAVRRATDASLAECRAAGGRPSLSRGFETARDLNGDGVADYVLDLSRLDCRGAESFFCGSAGCVLEVLVSTPDGGHRRAFTDNVRGWSINGSSDPPTLDIGMHGAACGRTGDVTCPMPLRWNGRELAVVGGRAQRPPAAPAPAIPPPAPGAVPGAAAAWSVRPALGGAMQIAFVPGTGLLREFVVACDGGNAVAGVYLRASPPTPGPQPLALAGGGRRMELSVQAPPNRPLIFMAVLRSPDVSRLIEGARDGLSLQLGGTPLGTVPVGGAGAAMRAALAGCTWF